MHYVNVSDLAGPDWRFLEPWSTDPALSWECHSGLARNGLERRVRGLARYRGALAAVRAAAARPDAVLVSHLPVVTLAVAVVMRTLRVHRPHVAFAFNYTNLPQGLRLARTRKYLADVTEFVVPSRDEIRIYSGLLGLPAERFRFLPWSIGAPEVSATATPPFAGRYLSAIGGEGRDYRTLAEAAALLPDVPVAIVARPHSIEGLSFPPNVRVFTNLPSPETWAIAQHSAAMLVPLRSARTANGHVSIISAQRLGIPLVVTRSAGVADYVDDETALLAEAGNAGDLAAAMRRVLDAPDETARRAARAREKADHDCDTSSWLRYFSELDGRLRGAAGQGG